MLNAQVYWSGLSFFLFYFINFFSLQNIKWACIASGLNLKYLFNQYQDNGEKKNWVSPIHPGTQHTFFGKTMQKNLLKMAFSENEFDLKICAIGNNGIEPTKQMMSQPWHIKSYSWIERCPFNALFNYPDHSMQFNFIEIDGRLCHDSHHDIGLLCYGSLPNAAIDRAIIASDPFRNAF